MKLSELGMEIDVLVAAGHGQKQVAVFVGNELYEVTEAQASDSDSVVLYVDEAVDAS